MKKTVLIGLAILMVSSFSLSAMAIGGAYSTQLLNNGAGNGALTFKLDKWDPVFGLSFGGNSDYFRLGFSADWWMYHKPLAGIVSIYLGPGLYVNLGLGETSNVDVGARIPIGFQIFPIDPLELFIEIAPSIGLDLNPVAFPVWGLQGAIGFRFWF